MDFFPIMNGIIAFFHDNIVISIILALILLYALYRSPKLFLLILVVAFLLTGIFYVISDVASTGSHQKKEMTRERAVP
jgi:hypothetical protein